MSIECNLAVAMLDAGDLAEAEILMERSWELSGSVDMGLHRFVQVNNRAELALAQQDLRAAELSFREAATYLGHTTPTYMQDIVHAGLGYCALESGNLAEARRRAQELHDPPSSWYFDPTTILTFRSRLLERRGSIDEAVQLLESGASDLENRLVLAWLKVRGMQVRLMVRRRYDRIRAKRIAREAAELAASLGLTYRVKEFTALGRNIGERAGPGI